MKAIICTRIADYLVEGLFGPLHSQDEAQGIAWFFFSFFFFFLERHPKQISYIRAYSSYRVLGNTDSNAKPPSTE